MPKRAHLIAGILAPLCLVAFFLSTVLTELFGSHAAVAQLKASIVTPGLWIMIPAIAAAGGSGMFLGRSRSGRLVDAKKKRMPFIAANGNRAVAVVTNLTFLLTSFWLMAVMLVVLSRTMFAWGMDRMGPKWFTSVNPRTATPVWNFVTYLVLTLIGLVIYQIWIPTMSLFVGVGVFLIGVYLITGVSAMVLPYRKKTRDIWHSSPYRGWKIAGIPVICIAGAVWVLYTGVLRHYQFIDPQVRPAGVGFKQIYFLVGCGVLGVLWYYFWAWRSKRVGVDVRFQYSALPPE